ncbi:hypothetical protein Acr_15g0003160 [Actinidia rufa]|uniref:Transcription factor Iwr1 domain-containing protein n=1 Tax=Actinidia rufa TaxID=165716 RepID=A0A7J0FTG2_9ERIC|nr:hypothetical protein Acr_15g0003160 [Actinidia rufa]
MTDIGASSSSPSKDDKPVIVRVKRKAYHSPLEAFWLEINERPLKRQLLGLEKLSISDTPQQVKGLKPKKVFVQHVETISSSEDTIDVLQSFVPNSVDGHESKAKNDERRHTFKTENKQDKLLVKAKQKQEVLSKNARFEQIWRSRKGKKEEMRDQALREMCQVYDVVRVDVEETMKEVHEQESDTDLEDHRIMSTYLPLLREFIPSAAAEIESDIHDYMSQRGSKDDYVYDLYAVKDDINVTEEDASNPFPLVQVDGDDEFYAGPVASNSESDDSNAEDNPLNDYPDEETSEDDEDDSGSKTSNDESEERDSETASNKSSEPEDSDHRNWLEDADPLYEDYMCGDDDGDDEAPEFQANLQIPIDLFVSKSNGADGGDGLRFTDSSGNLVFRVERQSPESSHKRVLVDASGNRLIYIHHKQNGSWQGFTGNNSEEKDLLFRVERTLNAFNRTEFKVFPIGENGGEDSKSDFQMKGSPFYRSCTIYKGNSVLAQVFTLPQELAVPPKASLK